MVVRSQVSRFAVKPYGTRRVSASLLLRAYPLALACLLLTACGDQASPQGDGINQNGGNGGTGAGGNGNGTGGGDDVIPPFEIPDAGPACDPAQGDCASVDAGLGFCSDGQQGPGEKCDDANAVGGDGCTATCQVEADFTCPTPGEPCVSTVRCGDDKITGNEMCDDGNQVSGDGCTGVENCANGDVACSSMRCQLEPGWTCAIQGERCTATLCGDGIVAGLEQCEDGNATPTAGDGCDVNCQVEPNYVCNVAGAACVATACGDGVKEGTEPCDDGNDIVGDGCTAIDVSAELPYGRCEAEPVCPTTGACSSTCGDGLILASDAEECDDGNTNDGDGCSKDCTVEAGFDCMLVAGALPDTLELPFVFRDFVAYPTVAAPIQRHPDFQNGCLGTVLEDMVLETLDDDGKPVNSEIWATPATCMPAVGHIDPVTSNNCENRDGCGVDPGFAARSTHPDHPLTGHPGVDPFTFWYRDTEGVNLSTLVLETLTRDEDVYRFNPGAGFFPLDDAGFVAAGQELERDGHNFGFTSELRYWFQFQGGETLSFTGDDDLFVFVNGKLALAIGSKHSATARTVVLNADGTGTCAACDIETRELGIEVGQVYEIALFHAERQAEQSNFDLSLTGFVSTKSECSTVCGDGVVTFDEECDEGAGNDDVKYGGCKTNCKRAPFCGDGDVSAGNEECDDGVNLSQYGGCAPGCVNGPSCGDGILQPDHEQCDDAVFAGEYGGCAAECKLAPRCGDKIVQTENGENCDDGNRVASDGCSPNCRLDRIK